jgi:hypothetical protein
LNSLPKLPILEAVFHKLVEIFEFDFLLSFDNLLDNIGKLCFFQLMLLLIQNLLDMFIFIQEIVVTKLTTRNFIPDRFFKHEKSLFENFSKGKIFIKGLLAFNCVHDATDYLALLLAQPPEIESFLHLGL